MMAAALNATGRPIAFSCSWPAYEGGLPPTVSCSVCLPGSVPHIGLDTSCAVRAALTAVGPVLVYRSRESVLSTPEGLLPAWVIQRRQLSGRWKGLVSKA